MTLEASDLFKIVNLFTTSNNDELEKIQEELTQMSCFGETQITLDMIKFINKGFKEIKKYGFINQQLNKEHLLKLIFEPDELLLNYKDNYEYKVQTALKYFNQYATQPIARNLIQAIHKNVPQHVPSYIIPLLVRLQTNLRPYEYTYNDGAEFYSNAIFRALDEFKEYLSPVEFYEIIDTISDLQLENTEFSLGSFEDKRVKKSIIVPILEMLKICCSDRELEFPDLIEDGLRNIYNRCSEKNISYRFQERDEIVLTTHIELICKLEFSSLQNEKIFDLFFEGGANINYSSKSNQRILRHLLSYDYLDNILYLFKKGLSPIGIEQQIELCKKAVKRNHLPLLRFMFNVDNDFTFDQRVCIHSISTQDFINSSSDIKELLVENGFLHLENILSVLSQSIEQLCFQDALNIIGLIENIRDSQDIADENEDHLPLIAQIIIKLNDAICDNNGISVDYLDALMLIDALKEKGADPNVVFHFNGTKHTACTLLLSYVHIIDESVIRSELAQLMTNRADLNQPLNLNDGTRLTAFESAVFSSGFSPELIKLIKPYINLSNHEIIMSTLSKVVHSNTLTISFMDNIFQAVPDLLHLESIENLVDHGFSYAALGNHALETGDIPSVINIIEQSYQLTPPLFDLLLIIWNETLSSNISEKSQELILSLKDQAWFKNTLIDFLNTYYQIPTPEMAININILKHFKFFKLDINNVTRRNIKYMLRTTNPDHLAYVLGLNSDISNGFDSCFFANTFSAISFLIKYRSIHSSVEQESSLFDQLIQLHLEKNNINDRNSRNQSLLDKAILENNHLAVTKLEANGASYDSNSLFESIQAYDFFHDRVQLLRYVITKGKRIISIDDEDKHIAWVSDLMSLVNIDDLVKLGFSANTLGNSALNNKDYFSVFKLYRHGFIINEINVLILKELWEYTSKRQNILDSSTLDLINHFKSHPNFRRTLEELLNGLYLLDNDLNLEILKDIDLAELDLSSEARSQIKNKLMFEPFYNLEYILGLTKFKPGFFSNHEEAIQFLDSYMSVDLRDNERTRLLKLLTDSLLEEIETDFSYEKKQAFLRIAMQHNLKNYFDYLETLGFILDVSNAYTFACLDLSNGDNQNIISFLITYFPSYITVEQKKAILEFVIFDNNKISSWDPYDVLEKLLKASPDNSTKLLNQSLLIAVQQNKISMATMLLEAGACPRINSLELPVIAYRNAKLHAEINGPWDEEGYEIVDYSFVNLLMSYAFNYDNYEIDIELLNFDYINEDIIRKIIAFHTTQPYQEAYHLHLKRIALERANSSSSHDVDNIEEHYSLVREYLDESENINPNESISFFSSYPGATDLQKTIEVEKDIRQYLLDAVQQSFEGNQEESRELDGYLQAHSDELVTGNDLNLMNDFRGRFASSNSEPSQVAWRAYDPFATQIEGFSNALTRFDETRIRAAHMFLLIKDNPALKHSFLYQLMDIRRAHSESYTDIDRPSCKAGTHGRLARISDGSELPLCEPSSKRILQLFNTLFLEAFELWQEHKSTEEVHEMMEAFAALGKENIEDILTDKCELSSHHIKLRNDFLNILCPLEGIVFENDSNLDEARLRSVIDRIDQRLIQEARQQKILEEKQKIANAQNRNFPNQTIDLDSIFIEPEHVQIDEENIKISKSSIKAMLALNIYDPAGMERSKLLSDKYLNRAESSTDTSLAPKSNPNPFIPKTNMTLVVPFKGGLYRALEYEAVLAIFEQHEIEQASIHAKTFVEELYIHKDIKQRYTQSGVSTFSVDDLEPFVTKALQSTSIQDKDMYLEDLEFIHSLCLESPLSNYHDGKWEVFEELTNRWYCIDSLGDNHKRIHEYSTAKGIFYEMRNERSSNWCHPTQDEPSPMRVGLR